MDERTPRPHDRTAAQILAWLLESGTWYPAAIELDTPGDAEAIREEAIRACNAEGVIVVPR